MNNPISFRPSRKKNIKKMINGWESDGLLEHRNSELYYTENEPYQQEMMTRVVQSQGEAIQAMFLHW
jgi:hypothetical protein